MAFNQWILQGNVSRDVILTDAGKSQVAKFGVAVSEKYKEETKTEWVDVEVWGAQGVACNEYVKKGDPILIAGKLRTNEWTDNTGKNRTTLVVTASQVTFLGSKDRSTTVTAPMPKRKEHIENMVPESGQGIITFKKKDASPFDDLDLPF